MHDVTPKVVAMAELLESYNELFTDLSRGF
jgi:hypothetical protein